MTSSPAKRWASCLRRRNVFCSRPHRGRFFCFLTHSSMCGRFFYRIGGSGVTDPGYRCGFLHNGRNPLPSPNTNAMMRTPTVHYRLLPVACAALLVALPTLAADPPAPSAEKMKAARHLPRQRPAPGTRPRHPRRRSDHRLPRGRVQESRTQTHRRAAALTCNRFRCYALSPIRNRHFRQSRAKKRSTSSPTKTSAAPAKRKPNWKSSTRKRCSSATGSLRRNSGGTTTRIPT